MWYLLEHQNFKAKLRSNGKWGWYYPPPRRKVIDLIVMHIPVAIQDLVGADPTAESVAHYFTINSRPASAHVVIDADSTVPLLPDIYTAFHVRGYNSRSVGVEQGWGYLDWGKHPARDRQVIEQVANWCRPRVTGYSIPLRQLTKTQVDAGMSGFAAHSTLDPTRRKDPGPDYPWTLLFNLIDNTATDTGGDGSMMLPELKYHDGYSRYGTGNLNRWVQRLQALLAVDGYIASNTFDADHRPDGLFGPGTKAAVGRFEVDHGLPSDGIVDTEVWKALLT